MKVTIMDGKLHLDPGGVYDMVGGSEVEKDVAMLGILIMNIERMIEIQCDCGEVQDIRTPHGGDLMAIADQIYGEFYKDLVENYRLVKLEFPDYRKGLITIPEWLFKEPWVDQSYHNDACPTFFHPACEIVVAVNYDDEAKRDYPIKKYFVNSVDVCPETGGQEYEMEMFETEDEVELKNWLETATLPRGEKS